MRAVTTYRHTLSDADRLAADFHKDLFPMISANAMLGTNQQVREALSINQTLKTLGIEPWRMAIIASELQWIIPDHGRMSPALAPAVDEDLRRRYGIGIDDLARDPMDVRRLMDQHAERLDRKRQTENDEAELAASIDVQDLERRITDLGTAIRNSSEESLSDPVTDLALPITRFAENVRSGSGIVDHMRLDTISGDAIARILEAFRGDDEDDVTDVAGDIFLTANAVHRTDRRNAHRRIRVMDSDYELLPMVLNTPDQIRKVSEPSTPADMVEVRRRIAGELDLVVLLQKMGSMQDVIIEVRSMYFERRNRK